MLPVIIITIIIIIIIIIITSYPKVKKIRCKLTGYNATRESRRTAIYNLVRVQ